jgi:hypothetical protein
LSEKLKGFAVMAGLVRLVPAIHVLFAAKNVDHRDKPGDDGV